jgi:glycosyltransferase involved in cell wall biosynthesis
LKEDRHISVIPMGVDSYTMFLPPPDGTAREGLLFVGRLVDKKGVEYLIQALPRVLETHPTEILTIIGSGPLQQSLMDSCRSLAISDRVSFLGSLVNTEIPKYLQSSAVTVFPSVVTDDGDQEGTPVAIMEALSCECSLVVSDYPGARDIIEDGINGYLVAQKSPDQIAQKIGALLDNPDLGTAIGKAGRHSVQQHYDWQVIGSKFSSLFQALLQTAQAPKPSPGSSR